MRNISEKIENIKRSCNNLIDKINQSPEVTSEWLSTTSTISTIRIPFLRALVTQFNEMSFDDYDAKEKMGDEILKQFIGYQSILMGIYYRTRKAELQGSTITAPSLYFEEAQSRPIYTRNPTGNISVSQLLQGKPPWIKPVFSRAHKKKVIILNDWTFSNWSEVKRIEMAIKFDQLLNEGFSIYYTNSEMAIVSLKPPCLDILNNSDATVAPIAVLLPEDEIIPMVAKLNNLSRDQIHILNDYGVDCLLDDRAIEKPRVIRISDLLYLSDSLGRNYWNALLKSLKYASPPITEIIHDVYPNPYFNLFSNLVEYLPNAQKTMHHGFEKINLEEYSYVDEHDFLTFLQSNPSLKTLMFKSSYIQPNQQGKISIALQANSLPNLQVIDLHRSSAPLGEILTAAPNLKTLNIKSSHGIELKSSLEKNSLLHLEVIDLSDSSLPYDSMTTLLQAAPRLKKLTLGSVDVSFSKKASLVLEKGSLLGLEEIYFSPTDSNLSAGYLTSLLEAAPNLTLECRNKLNELIKRPQKEQAANTIWLEPELSGVLKSQPINPRHHAQAHKDFKPPSEEAPFQFKGANKTKNQGMVIEKLSQYLSLEQKHLWIIPKIQKGICSALVQYAETMPHEDWMAFLEQTGEWNGQSPLPQELQEKFETLVQYILKYQLSTSPEAKLEFLGDGWEKTLIKQRKPHILYNPWHAIRIEPVGQDQWRIYDPNYVTDPILVAKEDLAATVTQAIGKLISVKSNRTHITPFFSNHQNFIEEGGLLTLCRNTNTDALLPKLAQTYYSRQALDGLLLRDMAGEPAWFVGLNHRKIALNDLTHHLLQQFISANPDDYIEQLTRSLEVLTPAQKNECITKLIQVTAQKKLEAKKTGSAAPLDKLISHIRASSNTERFDKQLQPWDKQAKSVDSLLQYCQSTCMPEHSKRLIELSSAQQVNILRLNLQSYAKSTQRPVFYVHSPEDLVCSAPYIKRHKDNTGTIHKGPGGALYDFLQENQGKSPIIIVNYAHFYADDLVRFNGLLDNKPHADGANLPSSTQIIGLMNRNHPDCYQGSDFYSRFDKTEICPLSETQWKSASSQFRYVDASEDMKPTIIELFHALDWKERLLGRWVLDGNNIHFEEGELAKAIALGHPIQIQHGLWDNEEFQRVLQDAIPSNCPLLKPPPKEPYLWGHLCSALTSPDKKSTSHIPIILNPTCLGSFLSRYALDEKTHSLIKKPGVLQEAINRQQNPLNIFVTRTLGDDEWAMLLTESNRLGLKLHIEAAPDVLFPSSAFQSIKQSELQINPENSPDEIYISTDIDTTVDLLNSQSNHIVIDVTECSAADLLLKIDGELNLQSHRFEFQQSLSALSEAMSNNKKVILKGQFSPDLSDELAAFLQKRHQTVPPGQLIVVSDDNEVLRCFSKRYQHIVTVDEKKSCLKEFESITPEQLADESLSKLKARRDTFKINPTAKSSDEAWIGMHSLDDSERPNLDDFDMNTSSVEANEFIQQRRQAVNRVLQHTPYVFLSGLTGVGKSTFVEQEMGQEDGKLFFSESKIKEWALDKSNKRKLLFLDEANLSYKQWSEFEGLFNDPPTILVGGTLYPLSPNHKVIFAGNPVNYGDERTLAPFFARHGNAVLFAPLSLAVIYEKILKPVCDNQNVSPKIITPHILKIYRFLCDCSQTEVLISPRELQMIALMSFAYAKKHPKENIQNIVAHFAYTIAKNLVPKEKLGKFEEQFKPTHTLENFVATDNDEFHTTQSRHAILQQLDTLLNLSTWRKQPGLNDAQRYGGLGGIVVEGAPGIGKSELVTHTLVAHGYQEEKDYKNPSLLENPFYRISASLSPNEKEALLLKAFHEGAIVVIDEINSSPMLERLLNNLLMGKTPDNQRPEKPGFLIIGTQNPVTMAGRRVASTALQRRLIAVELPEYSNDEMKTILVQRGINSLDAEIMVKAYEKNRIHAIKHHLTPTPTFRDLMRVADNELNLIGNPKVQKSATPVLQQKQKDNPRDVADLEKSSTSENPAIRHLGTEILKRVPISDGQHKSGEDSSENQRVIRKEISKSRHTEIRPARRVSIQTDNSGIQSKPISTPNTTVDLKKRLRTLNGDNKLQNNTRISPRFASEKSIPENVITQTSPKERFIEDVVRDVHEALTDVGYIENCHYEVIETTPKKSYIEVSTTANEPLLQIRPEKVKVYSMFTKDRRLDDFQKATIVLKSLGIPPEFPERLDISKPESSLGLAIYEAFDYLKREADSSYRRD